MCLLMSTESCASLFLGTDFGIMHAKHSCVLYLYVVLLNVHTAT